MGLLAILDTGAPDLVGEFTARADEALLLSIVVQEWGVRASPEEIRRLEPSVRLEALAGRLREEQRLAFADAPWLAGRVERFQARLRALEAYRPDPYSGQILLLRTAETGSDDDVASDYPHDPAMGWQAFSREEVAVHVVPGSHATMADEPHVVSLVEQLETRLNASCARGAVAARAELRRN
ncbi:MAG: hypothetical protein AUI36_28135 [Cyanobacteria bacterium 13_1_40CM_2_61_4]|nr:MAG: hypothetical protein AUI36_28135 [Cyanobacteria bacterium 13_1_40CM_2_61_4]